MHSEFTYYRRGGFLHDIKTCHAPVKYKILKKFRDTTDDEPEHYMANNLIEEKKTHKQSWCSNEFIQEAIETVERIKKGLYTVARSIK